MMVTMMRMMRMTITVTMMIDVMMMVTMMATTMTMMMMIMSYNDIQNVLDNCVKVLLWLLWGNSSHSNVAINILQWKLQ